MKTNAAGRAKRKSGIRRLAGVNRKIAKLCNELESLQQVQGALQRELEQGAPEPGRPY